MYGWSKSESSSRNFRGRFEDTTFSKYFGTSFASISIFNFGSLPNRARHAPRNRSGSRKKIVSCRRLLQRREAAIVRGRTTGAVATRPPKASLAQPTSSAAPPRKKSRPSQTQFSIPPMPPKPREHKLGHDFAQKFDRCIPVVAASVRHRGCASPPKRSQER